MQTGETMYAQTDNNISCQVEFPEIGIMRLPHALSGVKCKKLIDFAEQSNAWYRGLTRIDGIESADDTIKTSQSFNVPTGSPCDVFLEKMFYYAAQELYMSEYPNCHCEWDCGYRVCRYREGEFYARHVDGGKFNSTQIASAIIYLNDDYEGGELCFDRQNLHIKPRQGDLFMWPAHYCYPHESTPITTGVKYMSTCFFSTGGV